MIEITVTHKTEEEKIQNVREQAISNLEIDLEHFERTFSLEDLEKEVIYNTSNKKWLLNIRAEKIKSLAYQVSERKVCNSRGPTSCPITKQEVEGYKQISWMRDCNYCEYCIGIEQETVGAKYDKKGYPESTIRETDARLKSRHRLL